MTDITEALTDHDVREAFAFEMRRIDRALAAESGDTPPTKGMLTYEREFDAWLADVKAAAWTEGRQALEFWDGADDADRNPYKCPACEAVPGDNDHCVYTGAPHAWHRCDGIMAPDSDCPEAPIHQVGSAT